MELTFKPRLTKGRHLQTVDEAGPFCLVEAVGFNVDGKVDDAHGSVDPVLAAMSRTLNDRMCGHYYHPLAEAAGAIAPTGDICDACQARLWAVGERIAGTGYNTPDWFEADLVKVHVHLALEAAGVVLRLIEESDPLHTLAAAAIELGAYCLADPTPEDRAAARLAASRIENHLHSGNTPSAWAGHTAAHAARAAAAVTGDALDDVSTTYFFANRRCVEAMSYALGATAGDPVGSMRVARLVLNAFDRLVREGDAAAAEVEEDDTPNDACENSTSQGESDDAAPCAERTTVDGIGYGCVKLGEHVEHNTALGAAWWTAPEEYAQAVAADAFDFARARAQAAQDRRPMLIELDGVPMSVQELGETLADESTAATVAYYDGLCLACQGPSSSSLCERCEVGSQERPAAAKVETPTEEYQVVNEFDESELGDVVDEAIGDAAALMSDLERAEAILNAVSDLHRPVAAWTRRRPAGFKVDIEYQTDCCVACRDAEGQPIPSPCPTMIALHSFGEA